MRRNYFYLLIIILLFSFTACSATNRPEETTEPVQPTEINIECFIQCREVGFDEYGELQVTLQTDDLVNLLFPYLKDSFASSENIQDYLLTLAHQKTPLKCVYDNSRNYKNGDTVDIKVELTDEATELESYFNVKFIVQDLKYTISSLIPLTEYDPFVDLIADVSGMNGEGTASFKIEHKSESGTWSFDVISQEPLVELHNNDILHLSIEEGSIPDEEMARQFGLLIINRSLEYTITELIAPPTHENIFDCIDDFSIQEFDTVIKDWVIDGLNDENQGEHDREAELVGAIFMSNDEKSKLFMIYHITDGFVEDGYYVYISPSKDLLVNPVTKELFDDEYQPLTDSFVYYNKEMIRYTEKFKWGQDYEQHGFMYENVPYAGKLTLEEEINYLETLYSEFTKISYSSEINALLEQNRE